MFILFLVSETVIANVWGMVQLVFVEVMMVMNYISGIVDRRKVVGKSHFQPGPLTEIRTIADLRHPASRI